MVYERASLVTTVCNPGSMMDFSENLSITSTFEEQRKHSATVSQSFRESFLWNESAGVDSPLLEPAVVDVNKFYPPH